MRLSAGTETSSHTVLEGEQKREKHRKRPREITSDRKEGESLPERRSESQLEAADHDRIAIGFTEGRCFGIKGLERRWQELSGTVNGCIVLERDTGGTGSGALSMAIVLSVPDGWLETKPSLFVYLGHVGMVS
ncbi:hypothetical protein DY000_02022354 [Brassica cretica]|uniref:Uncharacterized protein n=1 Tax=Brassica cretica TaxID=69181 RepID=A0ABQ7EM22_BRACR|nr:hypothetical protein DY000_02022354 [Brassica cretica]